MWEFVPCNWPKAGRRYLGVRGSLTGVLVLSEKDTQQTRAGQVGAGGKMRGCSRAQGIAVHGPCFCAVKRRDRDECKKRIEIGGLWSIGHVKAATGASSVTWLERKARGVSLRHTAGRRMLGCGGCYATTQLQVVRNMAAGRRNTKGFSIGH